MSRLCACAVLLAACVGPRGQLLVLVDTDAPVVGQLAGDPTISADAAIDTVRIEVLASDLTLVESRDLIAPDKSAWPLSFGVAANGEASVLVRIRAFRAALAATTVGDGGVTIDPRPEVTIERAVELVPPADGVARVRIDLAADCLGVRPSYLSPHTTCIDSGNLHGAATDGVTPIDDGQALDSRVGSWPTARAVQCAGPPPPGTVCIPGGFTILGRPDLADNDAYYSLKLVPLRPVSLSPFFLDVTEMTVKRYGELLGTDDKLAPPRLQGDPTFLFSEYCTWLGAGDTSDDTLPVNCIEWQAASAACTDAHGALPSEAQWEHAARGRGQGRLYPWGDASPACCVASLSRDPVLSECGFGIEPVGTHPAVASCPFADLSRDLVEDLGGSMEELQIDSDDEYSAPCWAHEGVPRDPVCTPMTGAVGHGHIERGGDWSSGGAAALSVLRRPIALGGSTVAGFRCVYPAGAQ